jgi:hypothetical protein
MAAVADLIVVLPVLIQGPRASWQTAITRYLPSALDSPPRPDTASAELAALYATGAVPRRIARSE